MRVGIVGVGLLSAGLEGWAKGREVLAGGRPFDFDSLPDPDAALLPANERRRSTAGAVSTRPNDRIPARMAPPADTHIASERP